MKVVFFMAGICATAYTAISLAMLVGEIRNAAPGARGVGDIAAGIFPLCLGGIAAIVCFQRAFRKPPV